MTDTLVQTGILALLYGSVLLAAVAFVGGFARAARASRERRARERGSEAPRPAVRPEPEARPAAARARAAAAAGARPRRGPDWRSSLRRSRGALTDRIGALLQPGRALDSATLAGIEEILFGADIGVRTADDLLSVVRGTRSAEEALAALEERALEILEAVSAPPPPRVGGLHVVLVVGVNGSGKTTTIGKLASRWIAEGHRVVVAAADTFRAAAIDQLGVWAERAGAEFVRGAPGGDPAAVAFDAIGAAEARGCDTVLIDTAGRLQSHAGLMDELGKLARVVRKRSADAPHEVLLVLDANTGQNAVRQAREFARAVGVTGLVLTKLDGTAKGGVVLGVAQETGLPVRYVGLGEEIDDLVDFDPGEFVRALLRADEQRARAPTVAADPPASSDAAG